MSRRAAAPGVSSGCCASVLEVRVVYTILARHTPRSRLFVRFFFFAFSSYLPVVLSLLYCLPGNKDFVCSGLSVMNKGRFFYVSRLRVCCSTVLISILSRSAAFRVFCIASSFYSSLAALQRRAPPLPIIETQKSPCERCGLTRVTLSFLEKVKKLFFFSSCNGDSKWVTLKSFSHSNESVFTVASPPDEALPVFALLLAAGAAARRRLAGRAGPPSPCLLA